LSFPLKHTLVAYGCHKSPKLTISIYRPRCATTAGAEKLKNGSRPGGAAALHQEGSQRLRDAALITR